MSENQPTDDKAENKQTKTGVEASHGDNSISVKADKPTTQPDADVTGQKKESKSLASDADPTSSQPEAKKAKPKSQSKPQVKTVTEASLFSRIPWVALLAVAGVAGLAVWTQQNQQRQLHLVQTLEQQLDKQARASTDQVQQLRGQLDQARQQLNQTKEALQASNDLAAKERLDLEAKIKQVQDTAAAKGKDPLKWRIAEVDYLLALANHRLILSRDIDTAKTALLDADKRLRTIADPGLSQIRQTLAGEIKALESVTLPDLVGMAHQLSALVQSIEQLPLVNRDRVSSLAKVDEQTKSDKWADVPGLIWKQIEGLITIRRNDQAIEPLLPPDEQHYLAQNLGLKLEQARLALLRGDNEVFQSNLDDTRAWIQRYFDQDASAVATVVSTIETMKSIQLSPELPDISGSLRALRRWVEINKQQASSTKSESGRATMSTNSSMSINLSNTAIKLANRTM